MNLASCISHGSKAFLAVMKDIMLFTECSEDGGECAHKEFVDDAYEGYEYVVCDNCGVVLFMDKYGDIMFSFVRYYFLVVIL